MARIRFNEEQSKVIAYAIGKAISEMRANGIDTNEFELIPVFVDVDTSAELFKIAIARHLSKHQVIESLIESLLNTLNRKSGDKTTIKTELKQPDELKRVSSVR